MDLAKAKESVALFSQLMRANCEQVDYILALAIQPDADADAATATAAVATVAGGGQVGSGLTTYEDHWRFTFAAYHSGLSCLQNAVMATKKDKQDVTWENVSERLKCKGGADYVDGFMETLLAYDAYRYQTTKDDIAAVPVDPHAHLHGCPFPLRGYLHGQDQGPGIYGPQWEQAAGRRRMD